MEDRIIVFGCGNVGREALHYYGRENVFAFCDNYYKETVYEGIPVIKISDLAGMSNCRLVLAVRRINALQSIEKQLHELNLPFTLFDDDLLGKKRDVNELFSWIYKNNAWGSASEGEDFYSGNGSHDEDIIRPYIQLVRTMIQLNEIENVVEIGCGDFFIMRQVLMGFDRIHYCGIDVVDSLIDYNQQKYGDSNTCFSCFDASDDSCHMPEGDLLIIRQVLQHLDNASILKILKKTDNYKYVLITEHISADKEAIKNLDKPVSAGTRLYKNSGVYLDAPPFNVENCVNLLSIQASEGIIRTSLIVNKGKQSR